MYTQESECSSPRHTARETRDHIQHTDAEMTQLTGNGQGTHIGTSTRWVLAC